MLKIKDNVDLKVLKKYGFKIDKYYAELNIDSWEYILIDVDNRVIQDIHTNCKNYTICNTLYDLISNDIIEKVEK